MQKTFDDYHLMRKQEKLKNKDSMKLTNNHLDENNF
jgi:hypothetical protein